MQKGRLVGPNKSAEFIPARIDLPPPYGQITLSALLEASETPLLYLPQAGMWKQACRPNSATGPSL